MSGCRVRPATTTTAFALARTSHTLLPMPDPPPVTSAKRRCVLMLASNRSFEITVVWGQLQFLIYVRNVLNPGTVRNSVYSISETGTGSCVIGSSLRLVAFQSQGRPKTEGWLSGSGAAAIVVKVTRLTLTRWVSSTYTRTAYRRVKYA